VDCGSKQKPSLQFANLGAVSCGAHEYNQPPNGGDLAQGNANILVFREDKWPYANTANTLALTTLTFNTETGEIYDADMEINAVKSSVTLTTGDSNVETDLLSVLTHEAGHFIGVAHSPKQEATMFATYTPQTTDLRDLDPDDVAAVCSIYPPNRVNLPTCDATPRHGYSTECRKPITATDGCTVTAPGQSGAGGAAGVLLAACAVVGSARLRRRARQV
jgi:hypothetical protein